MYSLAFLMASSGLLYSQAPKIEWQKCLGGSSVDYANTIIQTVNGGFVFVGGVGSSDGDVYGNNPGVNGLNAWVVKLTPFGDIVWQKFFGGSDFDNANSIYQCFDGGYILAGQTRSTDIDFSDNHGSFDAWVIKLDSSGKVEWRKCFGGTDEDGANSVIQTSDGGYAVAGYTASNDGDVLGQRQHTGTSSYGINSDVWVLKLNSKGNIVWQKCFGGDSTEVAYSILETTDSWYIVVGVTNSINGDVYSNHGGMIDGWILKLNPSANLLWQKCLGGSDYDYISCVVKNAKGGYALAGITASNDGDVKGKHNNGDEWVVELDSIGNIEWQKCLGGDGVDYAFSIINSRDSGYLVVGHTDSNNGDVSDNYGYEDVWIVKLNSLGKIQWQKCYGGSSTDAAKFVTKTIDDGYIIAGSTESHDDNVSGYHAGHGSDAWIIKLGIQSDVFQTEAKTFLPLSTYPNPASNIITLAYYLPKSSPVAISIYSVTGVLMKEIHQQMNEGGHHEMQIDLSSYPTGSYFISISACGAVERRMIISEP